MNLPVLSETCNPCKLCKAKRLPFKDVELPRSSRIGELFHSDIAGPVNTPTLAGEKYYQVVIDHFSHFTTVYLLKNKSEAEKNLMEHIRLLKSQGYLTSRIRSDCGGEFSSHNFRNFCKQKGITQEYTLPYTQQQNGVSERANYNLMGKSNVCRDKFTKIFVG